MGEKQTLSVGRFRFVPQGKQHTKGAVTEPSPYGLEIIDSCVTCPYREDRLFCNLPPAAVRRLSAIGFASSYPQGAILFVQDQPARGVFILCTGKVKLSTTSIDGRTLIVRFSEPGELLGLPSTVTGKPYSLTAEVIEPAQVKFVARQDFLDFLREYGEVALRVAQQLSETYHVAIEEMRTIGLSRSAEERVARFLLDWTDKHHLEMSASRSKLTLTHEEIAEVIGVTRETVTRILSKFKKNNLATVKGSTVTIKDRAALEAVLDESSQKLRGHAS